MDEKSPPTSPANDGANADLPEEATSDSSTSMPDNAVEPDLQGEVTSNGSPSKEALQSDPTRNSSPAEPRAGEGGVKPDLPEEATSDNSTSIPDDPVEPGVQWKPGVKWKLTLQPDPTGNRHSRTATASLSRR
jgi:hypothetical protein